MRERVALGRTLTLTQSRALLADTEDPATIADPRYPELLEAVQRARVRLRAAIRDSSDPGNTIDELREALRAFDA